MNKKRAYGDHSLSTAQVILWLKSFLEDREAVTPGWTSLRKAFNIENWGKFGKGEGYCEVRPSTNNEADEMLRKRVLRVRPDIADTWMLHHDNAPITRPSPSTSFWPRRDSCGSLDPLFAWSVSLWLLFFPNDEYLLERSLSWYCRKHS
jgi:hypothetical protein